MVCTGQSDYLGFLQSLQREPLMAMLYGYFDESGKQSDHPVVTFAGVCVPQLELKTFDDAWNGLLRQYGLRSLHMAKASRLREKVGDKMLRGQTADERNDSLIPFADCINDHLEVGLIQAIDVEGFKSMSKNARAKLGNADDPYYVAFARAMLELLRYVHEDDRISVICDDDEDTAWDCYQHYRGIRRARADVRKRTISISFADDEHFPALQAADMVAFLARLEAKAAFYGDQYSFRRLFDHLITEKGVGHARWFTMFADKQKCKLLSDDLERNAKRNV